MLRSDSSLNMLIVAAVMALGIGYYVPQTLSSKRTELVTPEPPAQAAAAPVQRSWAASAPGRVEPLQGEVHISALQPGRIAEVLVSRNDKVVAGDLLVRLDDEEMVARLSSATAEAAIRKRERDAETVGRTAQERRSAEDTVAAAERQLYQSREELDRQLRNVRRGSSNATELDNARGAVGKANEKLEQARAGLLKAQAIEGLPAPTRGEAALAAARADLSAAEVAVQKTRIRAAASGTILLLNAKVGESAVPSPDNVLIVIGDLTHLRVRAEFEERDFAKVRVGQTAVMRSDAFPGKDFEGKVALLAQALGPSKLVPRGPRKPTDVDVLEVLIDLTGQPELLTGMRVDVFLKPESTTPSTATGALRQPAALQSSTEQSP